MVVAYFKVLPQHLSVLNDRNLKTLTSEQPVFGLRFEYGKPPKYEADMLTN
jgi:hypothetical protein